MSIKKRKIRRGAFLHEVVKGVFDGQDTAKTIEASKETLAAATPGGRVAKWRPHAEWLRAGLEDLAKAEALIDATGRVRDLAAFDLHLSRAVHQIDLAQIEETFVPAAARGVPFMEAPKKARLDALGEVMLEAWQTFEQRNGRRPSAKELLNALPLGEIVQEVDEENAIYWRRRSGKEETTTFKAFGNRLTNLRKKICKKKIPPNH